MRRIKRIAYLFLVFTLLLSLVACGGSKNPVVTWIALMKAPNRLIPRALR